MPMPRLPSGNMLLDLRFMFVMGWQGNNQKNCNLNFKVKYELLDVFHDYGKNECKYGRHKLQMAFMNKAMVGYN